MGLSNALIEADQPSTLTAADYENMWNFLKTVQHDHEVNRTKSIGFKEAEQTKTHYVFVRNYQNSLKSIIFWLSFFPPLGIWLIIENLFTKADVIEVEKFI